MSDAMIPTAQVLCDILNDPTIPAEALPDFESVYQPLTQVRWGNHTVVPGAEEPFNAALFYSLSAWLWGRGVTVVIRRAGKSSGTHVDAYSKRGAVVKCRWEPSPVEALAAVVRAVNAASPSSSAPA